MLEDIKSILRITNSAFDNEINDLIGSATIDLKLSGITPVKADFPENDSLIKRAIIFYCKANFGLDNPDSDKYQKAYDSLKTHLVLSHEYIFSEVT